MTLSQAEKVATWARGMVKIAELEPSARTMLYEKYGDGEGEDKYFRNLQSSKSGKNAAHVGDIVYDGIETVRHLMRSLGVENRIEKSNFIEKRAPLIASS